MGVMRPELVMKSIVPVVMAGVLGIYGLIIAVIISTGSKCCTPLVCYIYDTSLLQSDCGHPYTRVLPLCGRFHEMFLKLQ